MGFIRLPGSPHLSPSLRPAHSSTNGSSNTSSNQNSTNHHHSGTGSRSPGPSPYLLPRSPAIRSSSRTHSKSLLNHGATSGSSAASVSSTSSSSSFASKFRSKTGTTPTSSPKLGPSTPKSPALKPLSLLGSSNSASSPKSPALRPTSSVSSLHQAPPPPQLPPIKLSCSIESPPLLMIGNHTESTGALLSGLFTLHVYERTPVPLKSVHISILQTVHVNAPPGGHHHHHSSSSSTEGPPFHHFFPSACLTCKDCLARTTELARWDVLSSANSLPRGSHAYPFSHLVPGSVPATSNNPVFTVSYKLSAVAVPDAGFPSSPSHPNPAQPFILEIPLDVKRAVMRGPDRSSVRVFPPTDLVAHISMPNVAYPESSLPIEITLDGVSICSEKNMNNGRKTRWRMRKLNWRIDETCKMRVARCPKHVNAPLPKKSRSLSSSSSRSASSSISSHSGPGSRRGSSNSRPPSALATPVLAPPQPAMTITRQSPLQIPANQGSSGTPRMGPQSVPSPMGTPLHAPMSPRHGPVSYSHPNPGSAVGSPALDPALATSPALRALLHHGPNGGSGSHSSLSALAQPEGQDFDRALQQRLQQEHDNQQQATQQQEPPQLEQQPEQPQVIENPTDIIIEHTRNMCGGEVKSDWKTDFSGKGKVELVTELPTVHPTHRLSSNLADPTYGMELSHTLVVEIVVAEELGPSKGHYQSSLTGAARVLRMQFNLLVADRSGLGIAWDDEVPPRYTDVPLSPPNYENIVGCLPRMEDLVLSEAEEGHEEDNDDDMYDRGINARLSLDCHDHRPGHASGTATPQSTTSSQERHSDTASYATAKAHGTELSDNSSYKTAPMSLNETIMEGNDENGSGATSAASLLNLGPQNAPN